MNAQGNGEKIENVIEKGNERDIQVEVKQEAKAKSTNESQLGEGVENKAKVELKTKKESDVADSSENGEEVPKTLLNKYHLVDHKFHFRNDPDKVAFEDTGKTLKTTSDDKEIAKSMVELAEAKGWDTLKVKGTEEFKRTVWLEASLKGLNVKGYEPRDIDIAMLNDRKKPEQELSNTIEQERSRNRNLESVEKPIKQVQQSPEEIRKEKLNNLSEQERAFLTIFDRKMKADDFTDKQRQLSMDTAISQLHDKKMHVGKLVDHGAAPYKNDPKNDMSYFATIQNEKGSHTLWAKDLERTLKEQNIIKNDDIVLTYKGSKSVEVSSKEIDPQTGEATGRRVPTIANRGSWEAKSLTKLKETTEKALTKNDQTKLQVQHNVEAAHAKTFYTPKIKAYDNNAPKPQQPQLQNQGNKDREKNKEIPR